MIKKRKLDIVIPFLNEFESLPLLIENIITYFPDLSKLGFDSRILLVDDGSTDGTFERIKKNSYPNLKILKLSHNFGHQNAVWAGIENSRPGAYVIVMDGDGQDPPMELIRICQSFKTSHDVVFMSRRSRIDKKIKVVLSKLYYLTLTNVLGSSTHINVGDFYGISPRAKYALLMHDERVKYIRGLLTLIGYKQIVLDYDRLGRNLGKTKYPLTKMMKLAIDGITGFSIRPLIFVVIATSIGIFSGGLLIFYVLFLKLYGSENLIPGWAFSTILNTVFFIFILVILSIISLYLARIIQEIKKRPIYIIENESSHD